MFTAKNRDRFGNTQLGEAVRDEFDNVQAQITETFQTEHNPDGSHRFPAGDVVPVGACVLWFSDTAPNSKWLFCRGQQVSRSTYSALFNLIGTTYGAGDGSSTYNLPDLQQRFPLGKAASGTGSALAGTGGAIDHTHTGPSHTHTGPAHTHTISTQADHTHSSGTHTHGISSDGSHTHTFSATSASPSAEALYDTDGADRFAGDTGHTHTVSGTTDSGGSHNHSGATDVNAAYNVGDGGSHNHGGATGSDGTGVTSASGTGNTGTANPPYLVVNYIIFSGVEVN